MSRLSPRPRLRAGAAGFSLIEAMVGLAIIALVLGIGAPPMTEWLNTNRAAGAVEFYAEGLRQGQEQALLHNSHSRMLLIEGDEGKLGWRVDICYPTPAVPCSDDSGAWSTVDNPAENDPKGVTGFRSINRRPDGVPGTDKIRVVLFPAGADQIYFTPLGWVNQNIDTRLSRLTIESVRSGEFDSMALSVSLAGIAAKCQPNALVGDSRKCPD